MRTHDNDRQLLIHFDLGGLCGSQHLVSSFRAVVCMRYTMRGVGGQLFFARNREVVYLRSMEISVHCIILCLRCAAWMRRQLLLASIGAH